MLLKDWIDQNREFLNCDFIIKIFKKGSYKSDALMCETVVSKVNAEFLFGNYELKKISYGTSETGYSTIELKLWVIEDE